MVSYIEIFSLENSKMLIDKKKKKKKKSPLVLDSVSKLVEIFGFGGTAKTHVSLEV